MTTINLKYNPIFTSTKKSKIENNLALFILLCMIVFSQPASAQTNDEILNFWLETSSRIVTSLLENDAKKLEAAVPDRGDLNCSDVRCNYSVAHKNSPENISGEKYIGRPGYAYSINSKPPSTFIENGITVNFSITSETCLPVDALERKIGVNFKQIGERFLAHCVDTFFCEGVRKRLTASISKEGIKNEEINVSATVLEKHNCVIGLTIEIKDNIK